MRDLTKRWFSAALCILTLLATVQTAQAADAEPSRPQRTAEQVLADAKAATGGSAWDGMRSQHSRVRITTATRQGTAERWASLTTGRSRLQYTLGTGDSGVIGFDGFALWTQDAFGRSAFERDPQIAALAVNAAYRDRLAFWYPERQPSKAEYEGQQRADGADFDVVRITPEGGVAYEIWARTTTHRIERLREAEVGGGIRTEVYSDFRTVQGVTVPFAVQTSHGDPKLDERYVVELLEYNVPVGDISFEPK